ncbi:xylose ABC transporter substrate-binding protein [Ktedonobacteria bacterium brp13]|nr:xylose ABC transporter substrate-binding protein [Ktedonobacteria bacterium brp13]
MKLLRGKRSTLSIIGCLVLLSIFVSACGSSNTGTTNNGGSTPAAVASKGKNCNTIGVSLPETNTSFRWDTYDRPQLLSSLTALGIPAANIIVDNAQGSAQTQQTQVEAMISKGACILVVSPADSTAASAIVTEATNQHIPVIAYDRMINNKDVAAYVSFQGATVGQLQGQYIADHYQQYVTQNGNNNIIIINGAQTDNNALLFKQGLHTSIDPLINSGKLKNVYEQFTDWTSRVAQQDMDAALAKSSNKVAVAYVANDDMANSVIAALKQVHLDKKVLVTGQDASLVAMTNILTGEQAMTIYKNYKLEATNTAKLVDAIRSGKDITTVATQQAQTAQGANVPAILLSPVAVDKTNLQSTILADNFYTKAQICKGIPAGTDGIC